MATSYVLTFALGATVGGLVAIFAVACCVVAGEAGAKAADDVADAQWGVDETAGE